jgi:hypothetical protein
MQHTHWRSQTYNIGKPQGKTLFERPMHIWEDNIKTNLEKAGCKSVNWNQLTQAPMAGSFEHDDRSLGCTRSKDF